MSDSNTGRVIATIVRGIFLGGALGAIASWVIDYPFERALGFGMLCGVAASLTMKDRMESRKKPDTTSDNDDE